MSEQIEKLRATVQELEAELASLDSVDEETREVLAQAMAEISDTLRRQESPTAEEHQGLAARLQDAAEEFESSHPTLAGILGRLVNSLGQMGI